METLPIFLVKILQTLADRYGMSCTLEELTSLLTPVFNTYTLLQDSIADEKKKQARVLDALILLNKEGYIFLSSSSDESTISIKGLILVNNKVICN
ncbi:MULTISPECIES: hypothetical protein [unclassified Flavobacterium]|jgi:hypothetical protein|uniref:hypothetical protein n=1 Tax=unclassified Flavobacterium TaxID=196869 RepID=UPI0007104D20|nr:MULTISPECIES: hypothetical protein [unclassified Flavobacterium]KRD57871.1 hypothetical protein ASE40_16065 [Flavobacterium sp. Root935]BDU26148.1 hypothetical protein FLGSB24_28920 [Flavobacterium sp. GSB-24]